MSSRNWNQSTAALKTRLQQALAAQSQPVYQQPWIAPGAWSSGIAILQGQVKVNSVGQRYIAVNSGTTGATEPTHASGAAISDGGVLWAHLGSYTDDPASRTDAPTLTLTGGGSAPAGLSFLDVWANRSFFTFNGCTPVQKYADRLECTTFMANASGQKVGGCSVAFRSDANYIGFEVINSTAGYCVHVEGRPVTADAIYPNNASNLVFTLTWADQRVRTYEVFFGKSSAIFGRLLVSNRDQFWPSVPAVPVVGAFIGDSYLDGSSYGPFVLSNTLSAAFGRLAGIRNMWRFGIGGTGLLNPNAAQGPFYTYRERLPQVLALKPDVIFVQGSTNDVSYTQQALTTEALAFLDSIRSATSAPVFWFGPAPLAGSYSSIQTVDAAIAAAVAARPNKNIFYKSMVTATPPWLTGSHNNAAYSWSSNIGQWIGGDNVHPVDKGTLYLAGRMAASYANDLLPQVA